MAEISNCSIGFSPKTGILQMFFRVKTTAFIKTEVFASLFLHNLVHHIANRRRSVDLFSFPPCSALCISQGIFCIFLENVPCISTCNKSSPLSIPAKQSCRVFCVRSEPCWFKVGRTAPKHGFWDMCCLSSPDISPAPGQRGWSYSLQRWNCPGLPPRGTVFITWLQFCLKRCRFVSERYPVSLKRMFTGHTGEL